MDIYLVGGAVRDKRLNLPVGERDWVVVGATAEQMRALGYKQVGKDFPVFLHPATGEEYALARTERKTAPGYHGFEVHADPAVTLEDDLRRRDLTINAMAEDADGRLIDPFHGEEDLREGRLRHVSPAFAEDPVRILRVARFAARFARWGFRLAHGTHALMKDMVAAGEADSLVPERVWAETVKALGEPDPARYFEVLHACGALARIFPELRPLYPEPHHAHAETSPEGAGLVALRAATVSSDSTLVRYAALTHDLAAPAIHPASLTEARVKAAEELGARLRVPRQYRDLSLLAARFSERCGGEPRPWSAAQLLDSLETLDPFRKPARFQQWLSVCKAVTRAHGGTNAETASIVRRAYAACTQVDHRPLADAGLRGREFADALRQQRLQAIDAALDA